MSVKKLNILFLSSWYPNRVQPTLGNFVQKHAEAIALTSNVAALNVCSDINCKQTFETTIQEINNVFTVNIYFKKSGFPLIKLIRYFKAHKIGFEIIQKKIKHIDLIHHTILFPAGYFALYLKQKYHIPYIITEHWTGYLAAKKQRFGIFEKYLSKKIARNASTITTVSNDLKNAMLNLGFANKYQTVYNVVDTALFSLPSDKIKSSKIKFLHVSHLDNAHKNISGMLRVVKRLSETRNDFECWFVGDGDTLPHIKLAKQLYIYNTFAFFDGTKSTKEIAQLMKKADCFLLFSNYENMPVVISEAMACGLPVISTNVGGIPEHISTNFGKLISPNDEKELFNCLNEMIDELKNNKYNALEISNYAKNNFSYEQVSGHFHEIYVDVLNKNVQ